MKTSLINEIYGISGNHIDVTRDTVDQGAIQTNNNNKPLAKSNQYPDELDINLKVKKQPFTLTTSQNEIYNVVYKKSDAFISFPPSAGKTAPVLRAIITLYQEYLLHKKYRPNILYVVPRKQLAAQISQEDFIKSFMNLILNETDKVEIINGFDPVNIFSFIWNIQNPNIRKTEAEKYATLLVREITGDGGSMDLSITDKQMGNKTVLVTIVIYSKVKELLERYKSSFSHVIIDEVQELVPHPGEKINSELEKRYKSLISVLKYTSKSSAIILMTGSVNQESIKYLKDHFNKKFGRQFKIYPTYNSNQPPVHNPPNDFQGQLLNRSTLSLQPMKELSGYANTSVPFRINLIKKIVINKQFESVMIVFSKQQTGQGIFRMIEELIKILPPYPKNYFDHGSINSVLDTQHVKDVISGKSKTTKLSDNTNIEFLKYFDLNETLKNNGIDDSNNKFLKEYTEESLKNNLLYQGFIRGIAPMIGSMPQIYKKIIQYYFSEQKKLHIILATDALGIGANVKCRYLYLPTIYKFDGSQLSATDESSLVQLVHRAGRDMNNMPNANIYCSIEDYDYIYRLLFTDPRGVEGDNNSGVPQINTYTLQNLEKLEELHGSKFIEIITKHSLNW